MYSSSSSGRTRSWKQTRRTRVVCGVRAPAAAASGVRPAGVLSLVMEWCSFVCGLDVCGDAQPEF
jgi:hypothetical protein